MNNSANIQKSSRHQKIIGDFGENLICNWLSRSGLEVSIVDHTGIDIIAYNPKNEMRIGITVKSRTRNVGTENTSVNLLREDDRQKLYDACKYFGCEPWIAIYVETRDYADLFLLSLENYDRKYRSDKKRVIDSWKMGEKKIEQYRKDKDVNQIRLTFSPFNWTI